MNDLSRLGPTPSVLTILLTILAMTLQPIASYAQALPQNLLSLPVPGAMVSTSPPFTPTIIRGLTIDPQNPLHFTFIVDPGDAGLKDDDFREESYKLVKYFLAALTVPEEELWVNLSPFESDRIISDGLGQTEMGRDMLTQDYLLKQITSSLMYPEEELGEKFWKRVRQEARERFGTTDIPMDTFHKVWIVPDEAEVYEYNGSVFVTKRHLKVMLEEDYLAREAALAKGAAHHEDPGSRIQHPSERSLRLDPRSSLSESGVTQELLRELIIPALEKEVNHGENFATLRQIYNSMILATWYKQSLKAGLLGQIYVDQNKVKGIDLADKQLKEKIYQQYLEAFKKGVYNYIKEDYDPTTKQMIPRKYFSGGLQAVDSAMLVTRQGENPLEAMEAVGPIKNARAVDVALLEDTAAPVVGQGQSPDAAMVGRNPLRSFIPRAVVSLGLFLTLSVPVQPATPEAAELFALDQMRFGYTEVVQVEQAGEQFDIGLNEMLDDFLDQNGGRLVPVTLNVPSLAGILPDLAGNPDITFNDVAESVSRELENAYQQYEGGQLARRDLAKLEREVIDWLMSFLGMVTTYDDFFDVNDGTFMTLYHTIVGNPNYDDNRKTYVCDSWSDLMVILGQEMGLQEGVLARSPVYENDQGVTFPTPKGLGHVAVVVSLQDGTRYMIDQGYAVSYPQIGLWRNGVLDQNVDGRNLDNYPDHTGLGFNDLLDQQRAWVGIDNVFDRHAQIVADGRMMSEPGDVLGDLHKLRNEIESLRTQYPQGIQSDDTLVKNFRTAEEMVDQNIEIARQEYAFGNAVELQSLLAGKLQWANRLVEMGEYAMAISVYRELQKDDKELLLRFANHPLIAGVQREDGQGNPIRRDQLLIKAAQEMASLAAKNIEVAKHSAGVAEDRAQAERQGPILKRYNDLVSDLETIFDQAGDRFDAQDYETAAGLYRQIQERIEQALPELEASLEGLGGLTGVTDERGRAISGDELILDLQRMRKNATRNLRAAKHNQWIKEQNEKDQAMTAAPIEDAPVILAEADDAAMLGELVGWNGARDQVQQVLQGDDRTILLGTLDEQEFIPSAARLLMQLSQQSMEAQVPGTPFRRSQLMPELEVDLPGLDVPGLRKFNLAVRKRLEEENAFERKIWSAGARQTGLLKTIQQYRWSPQIRYYEMDAFATLLEHQKSLSAVQQRFAIGLLLSVYWRERRIAAGEISPYLLSLDARRIIWSRIEKFFRVDGSPRDLYWRGSALTREEWLQFVGDSMSEGRILDEVRTEILEIFLPEDQDMDQLWSSSEMEETRIRFARDRLEQRLNNAFLEIESFARYQAEQDAEDPAMFGQTQLGEVVFRGPGQAMVRQPQGRGLDDRPVPVSQFARGAGLADALTQTDSVAAQNAEDPLGGINLDAALLNMTIKRDGNGMPLPVSAQPIEALQNIPGFYPDILKVGPASLPIIFGAVPVEETQETETLSSDIPVLPMDRKEHLRV